MAEQSVPVQYLRMWHSMLKMSITIVRNAFSFTCPISDWEPPGDMLCYGLFHFKRGWQKEYDVLCLPQPVVTHSRRLRLDWFEIYVPSNFFHQLPLNINLIIPACERVHGLYQRWGDTGVPIVQGIHIFLHGYCTERWSSSVEKNSSDSPFSLFLIRGW